MSVPAEAPCDRDRTVVQEDITSLEFAPPAPSVSDGGGVDSISPTVAAVGPV